MSDDDELLQALGGGDVGRKLLDRLKKYAKGGAFASRCSTCGRWYVHYQFTHVPIAAGRLDVLSGPREHGRCRQCSSPGPVKPHSTP